MTSQTHNHRLHHETANGLSIDILEADGLRWLAFGDGGVQSIIDPAHPERLVSPLNQAMLAGLPFIPTPRKILLLGTGGGALARFFAYHLPDCEGDAVEHSAAITRLARRFFDFPPPTSGWQLRHAEARHFVAHSTERYHLVLLDIAQGQHTPAWISDPEWLRHCRRRLADSALLVINLIPHNEAEFGRQLMALRQVFPGTTACLSLPEHHNILLFAFCQPLSVAAAKARLPALCQDWPLRFDVLFQRLSQENPSGSGVF